MFVTACVEVLDEVEVEYITLPGWMTSIEQCRTFDELPANAQAYIRKIEQITQIPGEIYRLSEMWINIAMICKIYLGISWL